MLRYLRIWNPAFSYQNKLISFVSESLDQNSIREQLIRHSLIHALLPSFFLLFSGQNYLLPSFSRVYSSHLCLYMAGSRWVKLDFWDLLSLRIFSCSGWMPFSPYSSCPCWNPHDHCFLPSTDKYSPGTKNTAFLACLLFLLYSLFQKVCQESNRLIKFFYWNGYLMIFYGCSKTYLIQN